MKKTFTVVYPHAMRPGRYDGAHFICYLNESPADYKADEDATPVPGFAYTGTMSDGGTLIECDEWNRDKLINAIIRTRYLQTEEDAVKTHRLQQLAATLDLSLLSEEKRAEYNAEWEAFEAFRAEAIRIVNSWDSWE